MKLLIITQVVDKEHTILGFFHRWVEEFAKHCEHVHVIALQVGKHSLPENVTVHSLGKDEGKGRFIYLTRFYELVWSLRHEYDNVFVHMNQIYVILGALIWRLMGKRIGLWYAHGAVTKSLQLAVKFTHRVFTSTEQGMRIDSPKRMIVGQGIDLDLFKEKTKEKNEVLQLITIGRISRSKNIETLLRACSLLKSSNKDFNFKIIGPTATPLDVQYSKNMTLLTKELNIDGEVEWLGSVSQSYLPSYLQASDVFIHDGSTNSLDKVLIEASLCGCVVVSSNPSYKSVTSSIAPQLIFSPKKHKELFEVLQNYDNNRSEIDDKSEIVRKNFERTSSISNLISGIISKY